MLCSTSWRAHSRPSELLPCVFGITTGEFVFPGNLVGGRPAGRASRMAQPVPLGALAAALTLLSLVAESAAATAVFVGGALGFRDPRACGPRPGGGG